MRRSRDLEERLTEWAREYGGGKYERPSELRSFLASMVKWGGQAPQGLSQVSFNTAADEVQEALEELERQPHGQIPAAALRYEYLTPGQPIHDKLYRMRRDQKVEIGRVRYYQHLRVARMHIAAWLRIPYSEDEEAA